MPVLKCPVCEIEMDTFVLNERGRCSSCGATTEDYVKFIHLLKSNMKKVIPKEVNVFVDLVAGEFVSLIKDRINPIPRGDRRKDVRKKDRRNRSRTPGKFKAAVDAVYITDRKLKEKKDGKTNQTNHNS